MEEEEKADDVGEEVELFSFVGFKISTLLGY